MQPAKSRFREALYYFAAWLPIFLLYSAMIRKSGAPTNGLLALAILGYILPAALLGRFCWILSGKIGWLKMGWAQLVATELATAIAYCLIWHLVFFACLALLTGHSFFQSGSIGRWAGNWLSGACSTCCRPLSSTQSVSPGS